MNKQYRSPRLPPFFLASIREGRVALIVGHPRGTHSRYVIGCCLIHLGICGLKNNSRPITYGIGCVWGMSSLSPLSSLGTNKRLPRRRSFLQSVLQKGCFVTSSRFVSTIYCSCCILHLLKMAKI